MNEGLVSRDELVGLLFNVGDIAESLRRIEDLLRDEGDGAEQEGDEG
jgi:hypothetical protein